MVTKQRISHDELVRLLAYDEDTGIFTWKVRPNRRTFANTRAGTQSKTGYRSIMIDGKSYLEHHLAWFYVHKQYPTAQIDHINHNRSDNSIRNLRPVTASQNARNRSKNTYSRTQEMGIWYNKRTGKYIAQIRLHGKKVYQKAFDDIDEAIEARKQKALELGFHSNHGT